MTYLIPIPFNSELRENFRKLDWKKKGINVYSKKIKIVGDVVILASSKEELEEMLKEIEEKKEE